MISPRLRERYHLTAITHGQFCNLFNIVFSSHVPSCYLNTSVVTLSNIPVISVFRDFFWFTVTQGNFQDFNEVFWFILMYAINVYAHKLNVDIFCVSTSDDKANLTGQCFTGTNFVLREYFFLTENTSCGFPIVYNEIIN